MKTYTVVAAFRQCQEQATVTVEAENEAEACEIALAIIDTGKTTTKTVTYDPGPTYVEGVAEGADADPWRDGGLVPPQFSETFLTAPAYVEAMRAAAGAIYALQEQVSQMRGMFNEDEDESIGDAMEAGDDAVAEIDALLKNAPAPQKSKGEIIVELDGGLVQAVRGTCDLVGMTYTVVDFDTEDADEDDDKIGFITWREGEKTEVSIHTDEIVMMEYSIDEADA